MDQPREKTRKYVPALDGLRALAVLSVIAYHMQMGWAPGGLLGVTMFFVLSGYLITGLLLKEYGQTRTISLKNFWLRRVRRIIPAVLFSVLGIGLLCAVFNQALLTKMRPDVVPTLLFFNNWWQILHEVSYFEALGAPSPLTHFWSLSIEEQFYLVWPVFLLICLKARVPKKVLMRIVLVLAFVSALEMALMYDPAVDPSRVYYGTDTRAFSLFIGSFLAFVWPYQRLSSNAGESMSVFGRVAFNTVGILALLGLLIMVVCTSAYTPFIYRGGLLLCSVLTAVLIAVVVHPVSWVGRLFGLLPFVWVGKCSYSMYLWHYPIILLMTPVTVAGDAPWWLRIAELAVIFAVSAFSYYVVENPIRHGAIGKFAKKVREREIKVLPWAVRHVVPLALCVAFVGASVGCMALVPDVQNNYGLTEEPVEKEDYVGTEEWLKEEMRQMPAYDVLLIGDSVSEGIESFGSFEKTFPYGHIDGLRNRQLADMAPVYEKYEDVGAVGDLVVFDVGTNGLLDDKGLDKLIAKVGDDKHIWFVNIRSPGDSTASNNETLARAAQRHDNVEVIDWYSLSAILGEQTFFDDGIHVTADGARDYVLMIQDALKEYLPTHEKDEKTRDQLVAELRKEAGLDDGSSDASASASAASASGEAASGEAAAASGESASAESAASE